MTESGKIRKAALREDARKRLGDRFPPNSN